MIFDYVDIGTSFFHTSAEIKKENENVLLVEPITHYLEKLPSTTGIVKANFAISNQKGFLDLFYVPLETTANLNLPSWIYGCNKLGSKHPTAETVLKQLNLPNYMISIKVPTITFNDLIYIYSIEQIKHLKVDTEGHDHVILKMVYESITLKKIPPMQTIQFEYLTAFDNINELNDIIHLFLQIGYKIEQYDSDNKILSLV